MPTHKPGLAARATGNAPFGGLALAVAVGALISRVAAAAIDMPGMPGVIEFPQNRYAGQPLVDAGRRVDLHAPLADLQWITDAT